jgi:VanZ family protein
LGHSLHPAAPTALRMAAVSALVALVLLAGMPSGPRIYAVLNDAAHAPVFAALALLLLGPVQGAARSRATWTLGATLLLAIGIGMGVEWIQGSIGRDSSWQDVGTDTLGATCALGLAGWWQARRRGRLARLACLCVALLAGGLALWPVMQAAVAYGHRASVYPVLNRFDSQLDLYFVSPVNAEVSRRSLADGWLDASGSPSLRLMTTGGDYPGIITEPARDWRGWSVLKLDLTNPGETALGLHVRVDDAPGTRQFHDRFNRGFKIPGATRTVLSIPLREIEQGPVGRTLNLGDVARLIVFLTGPSARPGTEFYVTRIWLE